MVCARHTEPLESASAIPTIAPTTRPPTGSHQRSLRRCQPDARSTSCSSANSGGRLMRPLPHEWGGEWGTGRFPALSIGRGHAGETWLPPRPRAGGERCSCGRDPINGPAPLSREALVEWCRRLPADRLANAGRIRGGAARVALAARPADHLEAPARDAAEHLDRLEHRHLCTAADVERRSRCGTLHRADRGLDCVVDVGEAPRLVAVAIE